APSHAPLHRRSHAFKSRTGYQRNLPFSKPLRTGVFYCDAPVFLGEELRPQLLEPGQPGVELAGTHHRLDLRVLIEDLVRAHLRRVVLRRAEEAVGEGELEDRALHLEELSGEA